MVVMMMVICLLLTAVSVSGDSVLLVTLGGTASHKVPFMALARGLAARGHNLTFVSAFPPERSEPGVEEVAPQALVGYVRNYTDWDLLGARMRGHEPVHPLDVLRYGFQVCEALLSDPETKDLLSSGRTFDLLVLDGAYPECALGLAHHFRAPFMYLNTVGFYTGSLSYGGSPTPYSVTPFFGRAFTDRMGLAERALNTAYHLLLGLMHTVMVKAFLEGVLREHLGPGVPPVYSMASNVSFILQNGHATVTYPRPYLPNVAEVACIHCRPAGPLDKELEEFVSGGGEAGFVYVSMGSSVRAANMPESLRRLLLRVFAGLPHRVLWKWEGGPMPELPPNVRLARWLPQQDILGHRKLRAFVTHGGLLSMFETVYHAAPAVSVPVFCDHDANAAKAAADGYALRLELQGLTADKLARAIREVVRDPRYRQSARHRSRLLRDQKETPLERAIYWTEYVLRHRGAPHLQSPAKDLGVLQYYLVDVAVLYALLLAAALSAASQLFQLAARTSHHRRPGRLKAD
ncbi:UDP-glucosyltransferase 2 [Bacillus rossius redtenbacheri]|uniref:UDP-glucosyltransferase 2 n=1 Tax=Bacillus rossius redtenbacheri TaxID=93214 RepID=UPI002FDE2535